MNYETYTNKKLNCLKMFYLFLNLLKYWMFFRMYFGIVGVFGTINSYFEFGIRIRCIYLYMGT